MGIDHLARHQHLQRALASHRAAERDHRSGAEEADFDSWGGKCGFFGGDDKIAGGYELATGSSG